MMNMFKTTLLLGLLTGLFLLIGQVLGGNSGMMIALVVAGAMNLGAYWFSDKIVLRMYQAQEVKPNEAPELYSIVKELAQRAQLPMPKVYTIQDATPNAFATGRNPQHAAVAVTTGILSILDRNELKGVLAHELSHVYHRDTLISSIAATMAGAIAMIANMAQWAAIFGRSDNQEGGSSGLVGGIVMMIIAPIAATIIQMAVSRSREYAADARGAKLCGNPLALASALQKLESMNHQMPLQQAEARPATAHLFIVNPLSGGRALMALFSTHPPTEERIRRLREMASRVVRI